VVEEYCRKNPRSDGRTTLPQVLAMYRARIIHDNYFIFSDNTHDLKDIVRVQYHLHDILLRLLLRKLDYDDVYQSPIRSGDMALDWVQENTPAVKLGYK
jgi:hypothetical protein